MGKSPRFRTFDTNWTWLGLLHNMLLICTLVEITLGVCVVSKLLDLLDLSLSEPDVLHGSLQLLLVKRKREKWSA